MYFLRKDKAPCGANAGLRLLLLRNQDDRVVVVDRASQDSLSPFRSVFLGVERAWDWVKVYIQLKLDALLFKHRRSFCREQCLINTYVNAAKRQSPLRGLSSRELDWLLVCHDVRGAQRSGNRNTERRHRVFVDPVTAGAGEEEVNASRVVCGDCCEPGKINGNG